MSIGTNEHARLANDAYIDRSTELKRQEEVSLDGIRYKILAVAEDRTIGYQGTAYRRVDTNEVVIAHRGTESLFKDFGDAWTDLRMVARSTNQQLDAAMAFTEKAIALTRSDAKEKGHSPIISVTGHSLGGTLAQLTAAKHGLPAETFNAYGAGGLEDLQRYGIDAQAPYPDIINHRRATDLVSAASAHLGEVRNYATEQDVALLSNGRYLDKSILPANPLLASPLSAHSVKINFAQNDTIITLTNESRARALEEPIRRYTQDVLQGRADANAVANRPPRAILSPSKFDPSDPANRLLGRVVDATATRTLQEIGEHALRQGQASADLATAQVNMVGSLVTWARKQLDLDEPEHPGHAMYLQAYEGMRAIDASIGRSSGGFTGQAAACVAAACCRAGMSRIDQVGMADDGKRVWAIQGRLASPLSLIAGAPVEQFTTSIEQSSRNWETARQDQLIERQLSEQLMEQRGAQGHEPAHRHPGGLLQ